MRIDARYIFIACIIILLSACGGLSLTNLKKGTKISFEGKIDNVIRGEIPYDKDILTVTAVGFENGQGITIIGMHPGMIMGKQVKIEAEFVGNMRGTDIFKATRIIAVQDQEKK